MGATASSRREICSARRVHLEMPEELCSVGSNLKRRRSNLWMISGVE